MNEHYTSSVEASHTILFYNWLVCDTENTVLIRVRIERLMDSGVVRDIVEWYRDKCIIQPEKRPTNPRTNTDAQLQAHHCISQAEPSHKTYNHGGHQGNVRGHFVHYNVA